MNWSGIQLDPSLQIAAVVTGASSAREVYELFAASATGRELLESTGVHSIGIGEFGGVWIITFDNDYNRNDAVLSGTPDVSHQFGTQNADVIFAGAGQTIAYLGDGADSFRGGQYDDTAFGDQGNDTLMGFEGNDTLSGGDGADWLFGGAGSNILTGGAGADEFIFDTASSTNTITDFEAGVDTINIQSLLRMAGFTLFELNGQQYENTPHYSTLDISSQSFSFVQNGANVEIYIEYVGPVTPTATTEPLIVLEGIDLASLSMDDFIM